MRLNKHRGTHNGHPISLITYPVPADSQCLYSCEPITQIFAFKSNFTHMVKSSDLLLTWTWMGLLTRVELLKRTNLRMRPWDTTALQICLIPWGKVRKNLPYLMFSLWTPPWTLLWNSVQSGSSVVLHKQGSYQYLVFQPLEVHEQIFGLWTNCRHEWNQLCFTRTFQIFPELSTDWSCHRYHPLTAKAASPGC